MNSAWQVESQPQDFPIPMKLSWNERRKMARYQKQVEKDERKRLKEQEREQRREEKEWDRQWRDYYKAQEKQTKKWRKASSHHPELNIPSTSSAFIPTSPANESAMFPFDASQHQQHHHAFHLHSPHVSHPHATTATRPFAHMLVPSQPQPDKGIYTAQYVPLLPSLAAFGVLPPGGVGGGYERLPVVSR